MKTNELYNKFKQKASKFRKRYLKNQKIDNVGIDSIRGFMNYQQLKKILLQKDFAQSIDFTKEQHKFRIKGTGIYLKILSKDKKIYYVAYGMFQYYTKDNLENRKKLENILVKTKITSVDIAFDSKKEVKLHTPKGVELKKFHSTLYLNTEKLKVCLYDKLHKSKKLSSAKRTLKAPLWRTEITIKLNPKHLNKNKRYPRHHSLKHRLHASKQILQSLINNKYNNINITKTITKTKKTLKNIFKKKIKALKRTFKNTIPSLKSLKSVNKRE